MSRYRELRYITPQPSYPFYGTRAFEEKQDYFFKKYHINPENSTISPSIEKVSYASFFTKDINRYMIPADAKTDIKNLYYGTCMSNNYPLDCFKQPKDIEDAKNGYINTRTFTENFSFYTLLTLLFKIKFINIIPNGKSSVFTVGDTVAVGENGRLDKFTDQNIQKELPLKIAKIETQNNISYDLITLILIYNQ